MAKMGPIPPSQDGVPAPLADFFFIAGIESSAVVDESQIPNGTTPQAPEPTIEAIAEDSALESEGEEEHKRQSGEQLLNGDAPAQRNRFSYEIRKSITSLSGLEKTTTTSSNRSSATIRPAPSPIGGSGLSDEDFEHALRRFAAERDTFLEEIQFTAGAVAPQPTTKPKPRPKTQRIISEDAPGGVRSSVGTLRRRISTMSSLKRQPSTARQASIRTAKRLSGYNSVIPTPQPFKTSPDMHPLKRRYEPVLLDRYPPKSMVDELKRRPQFPDYVPMFTFPNDISVVSADERPRSTWHGYVMTSGDNSKVYGICVIIWMPLNPKTAEALERQCEEWRKANMTAEERELASSLGERLAVERAKLSSLLARLPNMPSGSFEREHLEDQISAVEERIGLMTDLLRPVRHGAASKIEGLTDGETGLWIPRAYGVLGRDMNLTSFWKEWLKAVVVPMTNGAILRVPPSSPKIGMWQPLERYVINLCVEALSPLSSKTQVEVSIRELRLYARKEAHNELPGARNTDLYALFRCLSVANVVTLMEYALMESRIILLSSHTSMLHLASAAICSLLYPMKWCGIFIPVLPSRLIQALDAPCPYIVGIERRYESVELPDDDFVLVDLDSDLIESTAPPTTLPRQHRRKLVSLLQLSARHHIQFGVPTGPPAYAVESLPHNSFSSENPTIFSNRPTTSTLATLVAVNSATYGDATGSTGIRPPIYNGFLQARNDQSRGSERPTTSSTMGKAPSPPSPKISPVSTHFPPIPSTPISRSDSGYALQATLREKRSGHFDGSSRRSSSVGFLPLRRRLFSRSRLAPQHASHTSHTSQQFGVDGAPPFRRPSQPFLGHTPSSSSSNLMHEFRAPSSYAPSVYAQSTLAASTIMPGVLVQPVRNTETTQWVEGHCLQWRPYDDRTTCTICAERSDEGIYVCSGCGLSAHSRCTLQVCLVCPRAFKPDHVRTAFVRCFASLFYTYRRSLAPATGDVKRSGMLYKFNMEGYIRNLPHDIADYMQLLRDTQLFNEFLHEREMTPANDPSIKLFDQIIMAKKNRGRTSLFSKSSTDFLNDTSDHLWRSAAAMPPTSRVPGDYRQIVSRSKFETVSVQHPWQSLGINCPVVPAKLDPTLMKEPRVIQGAPRFSQSRTTTTRRKPIPSMLGPGLPPHPPPK
ncbi:DENN-domain-containing protein [Eremomyces bilateralis CBS 781.70]|uniref:DENN-domain-containing protein n=1 Tax=Eremomyces bilateralis CBS 781.70 TaxID=1392243 RepID=A0A6G1FWZ3_9PEZI|nr:DENN-domain-containing protein [Eremomyces bilateralis CBS 781.70]KAF1810211.1 DENN-domain-containing protein [Eremomyces bilateralis CBS 781.70]